MAGQMILVSTRNRKHSMLLHLLFFLPAYSASSYQNVALRGKATQSHCYNSNGNSFAAAYNAIDGNRDSAFFHGSCTHTESMLNPWWRVDLLDCYVIDHIVITNRGDCCAEQINGAEIHIGNSLEDNGTANKLVATISSIPAGGSQTIKFSHRVEGRFVVVLIPGSGRVLTLCEVEVYGYPAPTGENVAVYGKASQSTVYPAAIAYNAIDGNRGLWDQGSCSATNNDFNPWWRLDLGRTHKVFSINITNRAEHPERIKGAEIRIGDSLDNNGNNNPRCAVISSIAPGFTETFQCDGMDGRYINIVIPGRKEYLTLCEVEVHASKLDIVSKCLVMPSESRGVDSTVRYDWIIMAVKSHVPDLVWENLGLWFYPEKPRKMKHSVFLHLLLFLPAYSASNYLNVALRGKATQSHRYSGGRNVFAAAYNAIDGNRDPIFDHGSCTHTETQLNPWWRVDLIDRYIIDRIIITNRGDCCEERISGAQIRIGNSLVDDGIATTLKMKNTVLLHLLLFLPAYSVPIYQNVALRGKATQSQRYYGDWSVFAAAYNAIDGNRDPTFKHGSCTHTVSMLNPWWRVDLLDRYIIDHIVITNRGDCCEERINGAQIHVGESLVDNGIANPLVATISSIPAGMSRTIKFSSAVEGRYVVVVNPGSDRVLTLCEVEVYGYLAPTEVQSRPAVPGP
ncbi:uncharacterized protein LOC106526710 [Austrofundulus limnaeus]|uniref:Uncharacterized protein LOC106526710 n=1 Tax=Austrofundulus limnaeus TaxID=52670 RepID=A0A2I4CA24_AUSLI|nr:PREDICTED: uncharacterized protein LOC106526710 [Austrofundulus limnaeus]